MTYGESNDHVTDDVTWPKQVRSWSSTFRAKYLENSCTEMLFSNNR